ncbi:MAG: hypothetical protein ACRYG2_08105 [Janthinobacterium lividum]
MTASAPALAGAAHDEHSLTRALRRLGWGVADQGISSLSNFALGLFVARTYGAGGFGAFTLAFVTYSVVLNASRGLGTDPLLVRHSGPPDQVWRRATAAATGTALAVGVVGGVLCVAAGLLLPPTTGGGFLVLGLGLPGLMLQDSFRFAFFACGRGRAAFANDLVWTILLVATLAVLLVSGAGTPAICLLVFGGTASAAAVVGALQAHVVPRPVRIRSWLRTHRSLSFRYLGENVSFSLASQIRTFVLGGVASLAAVGYVRSSEILMGPFLVLLMGLSQVAVPEASRALAGGPARLRAFCLRLGAVQAGAAVAWGAVLLTVFPLGPGPALLGEIWGPTSRLIPPITLTVCATSFMTAANAGLRAMGTSRRSLKAQLITATVYVTLACLGAVLGGAIGTSWGVTVAQAVGALVSWYQLRSGLAEQERTVTAP